MTYSVRIGSNKRIGEQRFYDFKTWEDAEGFARLYNVVETIQVKL